MKMLSFSAFLFVGCSLFLDVASQDVMSPATFSKGYGSPSKGYGNPSKGYGTSSPTPPPSRNGFAAQCPANPAEGEKCKYCTNVTSKQWITDCELRVTIKCTILSDENGRTSSCFAPGDTSVGNNNPDPRFRVSAAECANNPPEYQARIVYEKCNFNGFTHSPRKLFPELNYIRYGGRSLDETNNLIEDKWNAPVGPDTDGLGSCVSHEEFVTIKPCERRFNGMAISFDGKLDKAQPNYCRCFLREFSRSEVVDDPPTPTPPTPTPPTPTPPTPTYRPPTPRPFPPTPPIPTPRPPSCNFKNVIITELANPAQPYAKYIELLFLDKNCAGKTILLPLHVIRFPAGQQHPYHLTVNLYGVVIRDDGFVSICNSADAELFYGRGECTVVSGILSPAHLQGTESIAIVWGNLPSTYFIIDIFGIPGTSDVPSNQYFKNGRAVRKINVWKPQVQFYIDFWHVFPGECEQEVGPEGMDINLWQDVAGPNCNKPTIIITEIVDLDVNSEINVPRYVELHAPRKRNRGQRFTSDLKLAIFHGDTTVPHWPSVVPIDYMPENGFLVVCNPAAFAAFGSECALESTHLVGPANSNGNDQIAIISGDESSWSVVDIYGVIGEAGFDTDHDFFNSRVVRRLDVTTVRPIWSKYDWVICRSGYPDPNLWESESCIVDGSPSLLPSSQPTPESQNDCQFFFTELADCDDNAYIEIKSTCPGITISRDLVVVSWKEYGASCEVNLKGVTVSDDGFIIICRNKIQHMISYAGRGVFKEYTWHDFSVCDIEDFNLLAGHGFSSYAIKNKDSSCEENGCEGSNCSIGCNDKYLDIYGYVGISLRDTVHQYHKCRALREFQYPFGIPRFDPKVWHITCDTDCDPREWGPFTLKLIFSEFCDPIDSKLKRFIELYSSNRKNYEIKEELIVMKWTGANPIASYIYQPLKGQYINEDGFLVMCADSNSWFTYGKNKCDVESPFSSVFYSKGYDHYAIAKCEYPSDDCEILDIYGVPSTDAQGTVQDFTDGRAVRCTNIWCLAPKKIFNPNDWWIDHHVTSDQCCPGEFCPPIRSLPPAPAPSPSKGKGKGKGYSYPSKGKSRYNRKK